MAGTMAISAPSVKIKLALNRIKKFKMPLLDAGGLS
jgi:hypothetical protein